MYHLGVEHKSFCTIIFALTHRVPFCPLEACFPQAENHQNSTEKCARSPEMAKTKSQHTLKTERNYKSRKKNYYTGRNVMSMSPVTLADIKLPASGMFCKRFLAFTAIISHHYKQNLKMFQHVWVNNHEP